MHDEHSVTAAQPRGTEAVKPGCGCKAAVRIYLPAGALSHSAAQGQPGGQGGREAPCSSAGALT